MRSFYFFTKAPNFLCQREPKEMSQLRKSLQCDAIVPFVNVVSLNGSAHFMSQINNVQLFDFLLFVQHGLAADTRETLARCGQNRLKGNCLSKIYSSYSINEEVRKAVIKLIVCISNLDAEVLSVRNSFENSTLRKKIFLI